MLNKFAFDSTLSDTKEVVKPLLEHAARTIPPIVQSIYLYTVSELDSSD